jgi:hypothetical protein
MMRLIDELGNARRKELTEEAKIERWLKDQRKIKPDRWGLAISRLGDWLVQLGERLQIRRKIL